MKSTLSVEWSETAPSCRGDRLCETVQNWWDIHLELLWNYAQTAMKLMQGGRSEIAPKLLITLLQCRTKRAIRTLWNCTECASKCHQNMFHCSCCIQVIVMFPNSESMSDRCEFVWKLVIEFVPDCCETTSKIWDQGAVGNGSETAPCCPVAPFHPSYWPCVESCCWNFRRSIKNYCEAALQQLCNRSATALQPLCNRSETALKQLGWCTETALKLLCW